MIWSVFWPVYGQLHIQYDSTAELKKTTLWEGWWEQLLRDQDLAKNKAISSHERETPLLFRKEIIGTEQNCREKQKQGLKGRDSWPPSQIDVHSKYCWDCQSNPTLPPKRGLSLLFGCASVSPWCQPRVQCPPVIPRHHLVTGYPWAVFLSRTDPSSQGKG